MIQKVPKQSYKRSQMLCQVMSTLYKILLLYMNTFSKCHELRPFHVTDDVFESVKLHCHFINKPGSTLQFLSILHSSLVWTQSTYIMINWQSDVAVLRSILFSEEECTTVSSINNNVIFSVTVPSYGTLPRPGLQASCTKRSRDQCFL